MNSFTFQKCEGGEIEISLSKEKTIACCRKDISKCFNFSKKLAKLCSFEEIPPCHSYNQEVKKTEKYNDSVKIIEWFLPNIELEVWKLIEARSEKDEFKIPMIDKSGDLFADWIIEIVRENLEEICEKTEAHWVPAFIKNNPSQFTD